MKPTTAQTTIKEALTFIFQGIGRLSEAFPSRRFTIDGRLVGDIGEVIAQLEYDLTLDRVSVPDHDARMPDGRRVQIKATFKDSLTFKTCPDYYLGFKLDRNGGFKEIFNGPGELILEGVLAPEEHRPRTNFDSNQTPPRSFETSEPRGPSAEAWV